MKRPPLSQLETETIGGGRGSSPVANTEAPTVENRQKQSLFRDEAFEFGKVAPLGQPITALPLSWRFLSALILAMAAIGLFLVCTYRFERRETAKGILRPGSGDIQVIAPERGIIRKVDVSEGDLVATGQTLFVVSTERTEGAGRMVQEDLLRALDLQEASLRRRLRAINDTGALQGQIASAQRLALDASLQAAQADLRSSQAQFQIAQADYERAKPIAAQGYISGNDMRRREIAVIATGQRVEDTKAAVARLKAQMLEHASATATNPLSVLREAGEIDDALAEITQRRAQYGLSRGFTVKAPAAGRITAIQANIGQLSDPSKPMASIVPEGTPLVAVLYVASRGVGFIRTGQSVRIKYDAFPYQKFGSVTGRIASVSQTVLRPEDVGGAVRVEEPVYRVTATLDQQAVQAYGVSHRLQPGMALQADIVLERQNLARALFEPLVAKGWGR